MVEISHEGGGHPELVWWEDELIGPALKLLQKTVRTHGTLRSTGRAHTDGADTMTLYDGIVNSINLSSKYLYFKVYGLDDVMYHMPLNGSSPASIFVSAY